MISIKILAERIIRILAGGDRNIDDFNIDIREVEMMVSSAANWLIKQNLFQNITQAQHNVDGQYIATFKSVPVLFDDSMDLAYCVLPAKYISMPHDRGIHQVSKMKDQFNVFIPIRNGAVAVFANSPAGRMENRIGFYPEGTNIYFTRDISKDVDELLIKLVIASATDIATNASFIPPDMEMPIIEKVLQMFGQERPQDKQNNNNPNN